MTISPAPRRTVLIVENESILKLCLTELVETNGFTVLGAQTADQAICILETHADIGLIVTNVVMPGSMDGAALALVVDQRWPSIKVIVVSGKPGLSEDSLPKKCLFLAKPYFESELMFEIQAFLGP